MHLYHENRKYDNWWKSIKDTLSDEQIAERDRVCPETLRKWKEIFDVYVAFDMLFFALNINQIIIWITMLTEGNIELKVSDTDYFDKVNDHVIHMEHY